MSDESIKTVRARVEGRVQGVWYRSWTVQRAQELGLNGWVRNRTDGTVEALFSGSEEAVEAMLRDLNDGPSAARVTRVVTKPADAPDGRGFNQRPTA